ncbi:FAS1-like dehydratase domain-containing protein [Pseudomonas frederiksbergensis]|jgi:3-methylfumaryl-CoA hydratase|uniref:FAS1-like dehydratase domain-containing protein n=1 Tax=Pseudomonas frederiksbergensis TaxID=104087 RepID=UPI002DB833F0|nr:MaoC family dehydratase N-terminal domain-containing protein [Pseudomonas frederiksbergensis]WRV70405.1 MaoC family dehydratase N-terminal domain-containing protein [Pseudomonas frederiksbergensis]
MSLITESIRSCIGAALPPVRFEVCRSDIRKYAVATGQRQARFLNGDEAPLMFLFGVLMPVLPLDQLLEDGRQPDNPLVPELPLKRIMAGGCQYQVHRRIRAGDVLVCRQTLVDIYEKEGAQGPLIFLVFENRFESEAGLLLVTERLTRIAR